jgi:hypothetical protein
MSEQTPPPDQPKPPVEATSADQGATPPSPPPADTTEAEAVPPPPPAKKSRTGLVVGLVAGLVALALIAGGLALFFVNRGPDTHNIAITNTAGGMKRDKAGETQYKEQIGVLKKQFKTQFKHVSSVKAGLYKQDDAKRGPKGQLLLVGFKFKSASEKNSTDFIDSLTKIAETNKYKVTKVSTGDAGGRAGCISTPSNVAQAQSICFWATPDSGGQLYPASVGYDAKQLSKILLDVRSDVEKTQ